MKLLSFPPLNHSRLHHHHDHILVYEMEGNVVFPCSNERCSSFCLTNYMLKSFIIYFVSYFKAESINNIVKSIHVAHLSSNSPYPCFDVVFVFFHFHEEDAAIMVKGTRMSHTRSSWISMKIYRQTSTSELGHE